MIHVDIKNGFLMNKTELSMSVSGTVPCTVHFYFGLKFGEYFVLQLFMPETEEII